MTNYFTIVLLFLLVVVISPSNINSLEVPYAVIVVNANVETIPKILKASVPEYSENPGKVVFLFEKDHLNDVEYMNRTLEQTGLGKESFVIGLYLDGHKPFVESEIRILVNQFVTTFKRNLEFVMLDSQPNSQQIRIAKQFSLFLFGPNPRRLAFHNCSCTVSVSKTDTKLSATSEDPLSAIITQITNSKAFPASVVETLVLSIQEMRNSEDGIEDHANALKKLLNDFGINYIQMLREERDKIEADETKFNKAESEANNLEELSDNLISRCADMIEPVVEQIVNNARDQVKGSVLK